MRNTVFISLGVLLVVLQSNLFRLTRLLQHGFEALAVLLQTHGHMSLAQLSHELGLLVSVPDLLLPILVFTGVHEYSLLRGVMLAIVFGYIMDLQAGTPIGLFTFISVALFLLARSAGVRLAAQTLLTQLALAFLFALAQGLIVFVLLAIFGKSSYEPRALIGLMLPHAISTAVAAPIIFRIAERAHVLTASVARPGEGGVG